MNAISFNVSIANSYVFENFIDDQAKCVLKV